MRSSTDSSDDGSYALADSEREESESEAEEAGDQDDSDDRSSSCNGASGIIASDTREDGLPGVE